MNCRNCNTPHPPCELADKREDDRKGLCLDCLAKKLKELHELDEKMREITIEFDTRG